MKTYISLIIESQEVHLHFVDGTDMQFSKSSSDYDTDENSIVLKYNEKDFFINLKSVVHVSVGIDKVGRVGF